MVKVPISGLKITLGQRIFADLAPIKLRIKYIHRDLKP